MQAQQRPRFRQDLVAELVEEQGARFIDVADPDSGNIFRFYEVEYSLACAMDGERDVAGIVKWAQEELGLTPSATEVQTVIATLADLRFIHTGDHTAEDAKDIKPAAKAAAAGSDQELARGIVVGKAAQPASPAMDVELGRSGGSAPAAKEELPSAGSFDLGAPGAAPVAVPPRAPVEDIALGAPGARAAEPAKSKPQQSEVSLDLAAHVDVKADDVKEAVRASKVMTAVEVPKDLADALAESEKPAKAPDKAAAKAADKAADKAAEKAAADKAAAEKAAAASAAAADKAAADKAAAEQAAAAEKAAAASAAAAAAKAEKSDKAASKADKAATKAADKADKTDKASDKAAAKAADTSAKGKPAVELPAKASDKTSDKAADKKPVVPTAPARSGISPALVVILILALVGAGAFFVWKYVIDKPEAAAPTAQVAPPTPPPPAPPAVVTSKIVIETPPAQDVKAPAGTIDTLEATDKDVKAGDTIGMLVGHKPIETEIASIQKDIDKRVQVELDAATKDRDTQQAANNTAGVTAAEAKIADRKKSLDTKTATITAKKADLDKLTIKAPTDGKLTVTAKPGQKVAADEVIAKVVKPALAVATFTVPAGTKVAPDGNLSLTVGGTDKVVVCTVSDAQAETIKVTCPTDAGLADGTDVTFTLPK